MKKALLSILLAGTMILSIVGCAKPPAEPTDTAAKTTAAEGSEDAQDAQIIQLDGSVHVFWYTFSDTYLSSVRTALNAELDAAGIKYQDYDSNTNQTTQTEQVQTALSTGAAALVVNVVETGSDDAAQNIVNMAKEKDVPVIFFNREVSDDVVKSYEKCAFVGTDAAEAGHLQGKMIGDFLMKDYDKYDLNGDGKISYVIFKGQEGNPEAEFRTMYSVEDADQILTAGGKAPLEFYDAANNNKYLVDQKGQWSAAAAQEYMSTALTEYSEANNNMIELVICNNDGMAEGAISALEVAGFNTGGDKSIPVFGVDATDAAQELIKEGKMAGTVKQDGEGMAKAITHLIGNAGGELMANTDRYNVDEGVAKIRVPYTPYLGE